MAKTGGLGDNVYAGGYDLSGDVNAVGKISAPRDVLDFTVVKDSAYERQYGLRGGAIDITSFFRGNGDWGSGALAGSAGLSLLPTSDDVFSYFRGQAVGNPAASMLAKQLNYDPTRGTDASLTLAISAQANAYGLDWGRQLTAGLRTDTSATDGTAYDAGGGFTTPSVPASGTAVTNTSPLSASVVVTGGTVSAVDVNGVSAGTGDGTYTVPAGQTISLTYTAAPTWTWTLQSTHGAQAYLHVTAFTGTSVDVTVQHSPDGTTWSTLYDFGAQSAIGGARAAVTGTVDRYLRVITGTGTFSSITFACAVARNFEAVSF